MVDLNHARQDLSAVEPFHRQNCLIPSAMAAVGTTVGSQCVPLMPARPMPSSPRINGCGVTLPADQRAALLVAFNSHPKVIELRQWLNDAPQILTNHLQGAGSGDPSTTAPILSYTLATKETISCVFWKGQYFITGTDIVKILKFRFACLAKPIGNVKKFEEGVFSDLRNLRAGEHASLEEPKSEFLEFLYKHNCIRTQKKQKVFYWYEVKHDDLMLEAFERDAKRQNTAATINHFLQSQHQSSRMPMLMSPMIQSQYMQQQPGRLIQSKVDSTWGQFGNDPAIEFLNSSGPSIGVDGSILIDETLMASHEPVPKSPRITQSSSSSVDPALINALPSKIQRKVHQQARQIAQPIPNKITANRQAASHLGIKEASLMDDLKDPLLLQSPESFGVVDSNLGLYDFFLDDNQGSSGLQDPFLLI